MEKRYVHELVKSEEHRLLGTIAYRENATPDQITALVLKKFKVKSFLLSNRKVVTLAKSNRSYFNNAASLQMNRPDIWADA